MKYLERDLPLVLRPISAEKNIYLSVRGSAVVPILVEDLVRPVTESVEEQAKNSVADTAETVVIDAYGKRFIFEVPAGAVKRHPVLEDGSCILIVDGVGMEAARVLEGRE